MIAALRRRRAPSPPRFAFVSAARSHVGGRNANEDRVLARPEKGLWAVADGMGGHAGGEAASSLVVEALAGVPRCDSGFAFLNEVSHRLQGVNHALLARSGGSTVVALLVHEGHYACLWAGDSRTYLLRGRRLDRLTRDHSLVQELVDAGALTPGEARNHPRANVITRAVGVSETLQLEKRHAPIEPGDTFLLCSDGLFGVMTDDEIADSLSHRDLETAADELLDEALRRRTRDNVSLVLVRAQPAT
jgi:serine/threonine protein phosphatase PrpC